MLHARVGVCELLLRSSISWNSTGYCQPVPSFSARGRHVEFNLFQILHFSSGSNDETESILRNGATHAPAPLLLPPPQIAKIIIILLGLFGAVENARNFDIKFACAFAALRTTRQTGRFANVDGSLDVFSMCPGRVGPLVFVLLVAIATTTQTLHIFGRGPCHKPYVRCSRRHLFHRNSDLPTK